MKASKMLISTLKEAPNEAVIDSHILLLRAGMIRKLVSGVYNYMPLGLKVIKKIEQIIREEMDNSDAQELLSSAIQPKELWEESGRWSKYGPELMRFKDRNQREFCLGPTHEEIFTDIAKGTIKSSKNLPINLYQIQTKYRDEVRPRFGLIRGREFTMKDAYSFDKDEAGLDVSYATMHKTYERIFDRVGLKYKVVLADTGAIGGSGSHQFMALSEVGESNIIYCECNYAADEEKAVSKADVYKDKEKELKVEEVSTPKVKTIEEVSKFMNVTSKDVVKTLLYRDLENQKLVAVMVRGDKEVNEIKLVNYLNIAEHNLVLASETDVNSVNSVTGFMGPVNLNVDVLVDEEVSVMKNIIVGANKVDTHLKNVNFNRDFNGTVLDLRKATANDKCSVCGKQLNQERGIEVGQIFKLGTKYSEAMNCTYVNETGKNTPMVMGCYGIGVTRTMASIVEQYNDENGIVWPLNVAPYQVVVVPVSLKQEAQTNLATSLYNDLKAQGIEVIYDDRDAGMGFKAKDWELIGVPYMIICGKRSEEEIIEFKDRYTNEKQEVSSKNVVEKLVNIIKK
ncbi:MAG: proline--tRNA ligase [bacterium]